MRRYGEAATEEREGERRRTNVEIEQNDGSDDGKED
jgi:hypothetical protein